MGRKTIMELDKELAVFKEHTESRDMYMSDQLKELKSKIGDVELNTNLILQKLNNGLISAMNNLKQEFDAYKKAPVIVERPKDDNGKLIEQRKNWWAKMSTFQKFSLITGLIIFLLRDEIQVIISTIVTWYARL